MANLQRMKTTPMPTLVTYAGSGKTHNMVGGQNQEGQGLIPRAIDKVSCKCYSNLLVLSCVAPVSH